jgi:hypothetical protein
MNKLTVDGVQLAILEARVRLFWLHYIEAKNFNDRRKLMT